MYPAIPSVQPSHAHHRHSYHNYCNIVKVLKLPDRTWPVRTAIYDTLRFSALFLKMLIHYSGSALLVSARQMSERDGDVYV